MNIVEKKDFFQNRIQHAYKSLIDNIYEDLRKEEVLKAKLISRALK